MNLIPSRRLTIRRAVLAVSALVTVGALAVLISSNVFKLSAFALLVFGCAAAVFCLYDTRG